MRRLLIAESAIGLADALARILEDSFEIMTCDEGTQVQMLTRMFLPDLMVLDLQLPGLDGLTILQNIHDAGFHPAVLVTTRLMNDYVSNALNRLNVHYAIAKPCYPASVARVLLDMERTLLLPQVRDDGDTSPIRDTLLTLGLRPDLNGFRCTVEALRLLRQDPDMLISKVVYPEVVKCCGSSVSQVERAIRTAINDAWQGHEESVWGMYFPKGKDGHVRRPTNAVFLSRLAACLRGKSDRTY